LSGLGVASPDVGGERLGVSPLRTAAVTTRTRPGSLRRLCRIKEGKKQRVEEGRRLSCWSEVVVAVVRHWTVTVGNGATCSGKHSTRVHEARQGEEDEANDRAL
jgi:hypothetical protein